MNLKEHVRRVLKEEMNTKVLNLIKKIVLDYVDFDVCKLVVKKVDNTKDQYFIIMMVEEPLKTSYREELQDYLNDMIPFTVYVSISDGMGCKKFMGIEHPKQLSESNMPPQVLRRMNLLDDMFTNIRSRYADRVCDYRHPKYLLSLLIERTMEDFYYAWVSEIVSDDEWDVVSPKLEKYLYDKYRDSTTRYWENECNKKNSVREEETEGVGGYAAPAFEMKPDHVHFKHQYNEETELMEKCWKGYTQKGMKTMFGKRYPNCVKKKK